MLPGPFQHPVRIQPEDFRIRRFSESRAVEDFDCGNQDLNEFIRAGEVSRYEGEGLGRTYLVHYRGDLAAYFTVCADGLRREYVRTATFSSQFADMRLDALPALKIGRLAVDKKYQNLGLGRFILKYIAGMALEMAGRVGVRLLILQAKPESLPFYAKFGFGLTYETSRERGRRNRTMFMDLFAVPD